MPRWIEIGACVSSVKNWNPAREGNGNFIRYIDISSIRQDEKVIDAKPLILAREAPSRARQLVAAGDVLVSTVRPNLNAVACVPEILNGATASTGFCVLRPNKNVLTSEYLFHWVKTSQFVSEMVKRATGASYPAVSDRIVLESKLPLPPMEEQRRIAAILDKADGLRTRRRAAIAQLDHLIKAVFIDLFGDPHTNPKRFPLSLLARVVQMRGGFAFRSADYVTDGIPLIRIGEANRGSIAKGNLCYLPCEYRTTYSRFVVRPGDMLVSLTGTTGKDDYGNVMVLDDSFDHYLLNQRVAWLQPDENLLEKSYLLYLLRHPKIKGRLTAKSRGIRQANISNGDLLNLEVPLPPLSIQRKFSETAQVAQQLKNLQLDSLSEIDAFFASLQHRAFRGEL